MKSPASVIFKVYLDKKKEWRWSLRARNGRILADSAEGNKRKSHIIRMISKIILGPHKIVE